MAAIHPSDRDRVIASIGAITSDEGLGGNYDLEFRSVGIDDGILRWVRAKGRVFFHDHVPQRFIGSVLDITNQKEDEQRKSDFIGMVSHELKTPLTSMMAYQQMLQKNEGMGIKESDRLRLFERFYRISTSHRENISGFGIGLYLSKEIIERHNGEILVESESGKGSTFTFSLPVSS